MINRFRDAKWFYVVLSILLAVILWYYVRLEQDPQSSSWFYNVPVVQTGTNVLNQQNLTVAGLSHETVDLRVEAPASVLSSLNRSRKDITVTLDVSKCQQGENQVTYKANWPVSVSSESIALVRQSPSSITVTVDKLSTQTFDIDFQLMGKVAAGYQAGTAAINPEVVRVSGPVDQVSQISKVVAILVDEELDEQFAGDLPLTLLDGAGNVLTDLEVTLDVESVYVVLPVVVVKEIPLTVNFVLGGGVNEESDYSYKIEPSSITVSGVKEDMEDLTEISLGSIDLSKIVGSNTVIKDIILDSSLENVTGVTSANVTVTINDLDTRTIEVENIRLSNQPEGYRVYAITQVKPVLLRGDAAALWQIDPSQLRIVADMSNYQSEGTYPVPVRVYLDADSSVGVIGEYSIVVSVEK